MKYPKFLSIGNWLFVHISPNPWEENPFGGAVPANLYACCFTYGGIELNLSRDLRTLIYTLHVYHSSHHKQFYKLP